MRSESPSSSTTSRAKLASPASAAAAYSWLDEACLLDMDGFLNALAAMKAQGARPDIVASLISHYAATWLPDLSSAAAQPSLASWARRKFIVETLAAALPPEREAVPCGLLLRLLRAASGAGAGAACVRELERRAARRLDEAALGELMIPAFSYASATTLDVGLVLRLVRGFTAGLGGGGGAAAAARVARLVDEYLAEAAADAGLAVSEFEELARAVPPHARAADDGLYRAIDIYLKVHPSTTKQEKKALSRLMDAGKLSSEASLHAVHNERLPVRTVLRVLLSGNGKLHRINDLSRPMSGPCGSSPSMREALAQQHELRRLREDVGRLQRQCQSLQAQLNRVAEKKANKEKKKKKKGFFRWSVSFLFHSSDVMEKYEGDGVDKNLTAMADVKKVKSEQGRITPNWRHSLS